MSVSQLNSIRLAFRVKHSHQVEGEGGSFSPTVTYSVAEMHLKERSAFLL